jgi:hypothetical protein
MQAIAAGWIVDFIIPEVEYWRPVNAVRNSVFYSSRMLLLTILACRALIGDTHAPGGKLNEQFR